MKIAIYGTGSAFKDFMAIKPATVDVVACYSATDTQEYVLDIPIINSIEKFVAIHCDLIILALRDINAAKNLLISHGVHCNKILSYYSNADANIVASVTKDTIELNKALNLNLRLPAISNMWLYPASEIILDSFDYVRNTAFELMAEQISRRKIPGALAELGVYKGDQAKLISHLFPNQKFYLFDTFEGFAERDIKIEEADNKFSQSSTLDFSNTSVHEVINKINNKNRIVLRKGYFPDTASDLEENYCFVSLDVDLYAPTLAGLEYFYPRLSSGGCIFVHDYNNLRYKGVKSAVDEFQNITNCCALPLTDCAGSIVIMK